MTPAETQRAREAWHDLLGSWCVDTVRADKAFEDVCKRYAEPGRFYHTLEHVMEVLATVESLAAHAENLNAVRLAAWLHDVFYNSKASDNEERSAQYSERLCQELAIPESARVAALMRKTKTHESEADADAQVLIDADLAILGASESVYRDYTRKIALEYAWVPEVLYRKGRRHVLEKFLSRPGIYHFLSQLEEPARRNVAAEIAELKPFKRFRSALATCQRLFRR
jgi:predicted metal-dependent HD superfamily phosphohydrolase